MLNTFFVLYLQKISQGNTFCFLALKFDAEKQKGAGISQIYRSACQPDIRA